MFKLVLLNSNSQKKKSTFIFYSLTEMGSYITIIDDKVKAYLHRKGGTRERERREWVKNVIVKFTFAK